MTVPRGTRTGARSCEPPHAVQLRGFAERRGGSSVQRGRGRRVPTDLSIHLDGSQDGNEHSVDPCHVRETVVHPLALTSFVDEACVPQFQEMSRNCRYGRIEDGGDLADRQRPASEHRENTKPAAMPERFRDSGDRGESRHVISEECEMSASENSQQIRPDGRGMPRDRRNRRWRPRGTPD